MDEKIAPKGLYDMLTNLPAINIPEPQPYIEATAYVRDEANDRSFEVKVNGIDAAKVAAALNEVLATLKGEGQ